MGDEFDRQVVPLLATLTVAGMVFFDLLAPRAEPLAHLRGPVAYQDTGVAPWCPKKRGVALQLRQLHALASVDDGLQQLCHRPLRVGQVLAVPVHVICVSADVGNEENGALNAHDVGQLNAGERLSATKAGSAMAHDAVASCSSAIC